MFSLIPQIILLFCFGLIIWLIIKNLPKVKDQERGDNYVIEEGKSLEKGRKLGHKIPIEKIDAKVNGFLEKTIRRSRIILMKIDTYLQKHLDTLKDHSKPKSIFKANDSLMIKEEMDFVNVLEPHNQALENLEEEVDDSASLIINPELRRRIDLIAGVDKTIDELLPSQENIENVEDEVEILVVGQEDIVKKFNLEPEAEIIEKPKKKKRNKI